jgi:hypothetical protein
MHHGQTLVAGILAETEVPRFDESRLDVMSRNHLAADNPNHSNNLIGFHKRGLMDFI